MKRMSLSNQPCGGKVRISEEMPTKKIILSALRFLPYAVSLLLLVCITVFNILNNLMRPLFNVPGYPALSNLASIVILALSVAMTALAGIVYVHRYTLLHKTMPDDEEFSLVVLAALVMAAIGLVVFFVLTRNWSFRWEHTFHWDNGKFMQLQLALTADAFAVCACSAWALAKGIRILPKYLHRKQHKKASLS